MAVADDRQFRGVGTTLMPLLFQHAAAEGFRIIYGTMLADNQRMIELAGYLGLTVHSPRGRTDGARLAPALSGWRPADPR